MRAALVVLCAWICVACTPVQPVRENVELRAVGSTLVPRATHSATLLPDGKVLVTGGCTTAGCGGAERGRQAELFDPARGRFLPAGAMVTSRLAHTATPLPDGRVLLVGGWAREGSPPLAEAELYDPGTGRFTATGRLLTGRGAHIAAPLPGGRVLIAGGLDEHGRRLASAEIYDSRTGRFSQAAQPYGRAGAIAVPLPDGGVLVAGGDTGPDTATSYAELYDPLQARWIGVGPMLQPRTKLAGAPLPGGRVLMVGGSVRDRQTLPVVEIFDPASRDFAAAAPLLHPRYKIDGSLVTLRDGRVLVAGGAPTAELYDLRSGRFREVRGKLDSTRHGATATLLRDGRVLVVGGYDESITPHAPAYLFHP